MSAVLEPHAADTGRHVVQFYERDDDLLARAGEYLIDAVRAGGVAVVIATGAHREAFEAQLRDTGGEGTLVVLDAAAMLRRITRDGHVDRDAFFDVAGAVVRAAAATRRPVRVYGEMVALLWDAGHVMAAIELETLWNELATGIPFSLYCGYHSESVRAHEHADALATVCHLHSTVVPTPVADATWKFAADATAPGRARRVVVQTLLRAGHGGALLDEAHIVIAELAGNAVVHAGTPFSVSLRSTASMVRIQVRDRSHAPPEVRHEPGNGSSGRGMRIIAALARRWGVDSAPDGKIVWAELGG